MQKLSGMASIAVMLVMAASPAAAQAPFFQGKQVKVLVGFPPGGGTDLYGRVISRRVDFVGKASRTRS